MAEPTKQTRRRGRRSTRVSQQLEAARKRNAEQLAKQRQQEEAVEAALAKFFDAGDQIAAADADCQRKVEPHEQAIAQLRTQRDELVAAQEAEQGLAALAMHEADRTVEQVGELLGLGEKATRRLIATGREARAKLEASQGEQGGGTPPSDPANDHRGRGADGSARGEDVVPSPDGAEAAPAGVQGWPAGAGGEEAAPAARPVPGAVSA
ncbi:hypothetical protein [Amycolatopsis sp. cg9]|uniref:hypothetical protein n=1 Tax=Amycolatopsis sp. cg9 TaxID=3238801 RepID=UPI0035243429